MGTTYLFINQGIVWPDGMESHVLLVKLAMSPVQSCITSQFLVMSTHINNGWTLLGYNLFSLAVVCLSSSSVWWVCLSLWSWKAVCASHWRSDGDVCFSVGFCMTTENHFDAHKHNLLWSVLALQVHNIIISISLCYDMHKNKLSKVRQMRKESKLGNNNNVGFFKKVWPERREQRKQRNTIRVKPCQTCWDMSQTSQTIAVGN